MYYNVLDNNTIGFFKSGHFFILSTTERMKLQDFGLIKNNSIYIRTIGNNLSFKSPNTMPELYTLRTFVNCCKQN